MPQPSSAALPIQVCASFVNITKIHKWARCCPCQSQLAGPGWACYADHLLHSKTCSKCETALLLKVPCAVAHVQSVNLSGVAIAAAAAAHTGLDSHMPLIGIPNFLPSSDGTSQFYFATLKLVQHVGSHEQPRGAGTDPLQRAPARVATFSILQSDEPFEGIKLGPLLGRGAFGRVYRGAPAGRAS